MSAALLDSASTTILDPDALFEIIDDQVVELPPMGVRSTEITNVLGFALFNFVAAKGLGRAFIEMLFQINPKRKRQPDIAFVSAERWTIDAEIPDEAAWNVVPNLVVEVISPNDLFYEVMSKLSEYFQSGVNQAWVVIPSERLVYIYDSVKSVVVLNEAGELDGGSILPGFRMSVADIFPKIAQVVSFVNPPRLEARRRLIPEPPLEREDRLFEIFARGGSGEKANREHRQVFQSRTLHAQLVEDESLVKPRKRAENQGVIKI